MKKNIVLMILSALCVQVLGQSTNGLTLYLKGDNDNLDASGNGMHASLFNGTSYETDRHGIANGCFQFDGVDDKITFPGNALGTNISAFTISLWVYHSALNAGTPAYINKKDGSFPFLLRYNTSENGIQFYTQTTSRSGGVFANTTLTVGTWHHIVATYDGATMKLYLNNSKSTTETSQTGLLNIISSHDYQIGVGWSGTSGWLNGRVDDVRIYDRALTTQEIGELYTSTPNNSTPNAWSYIGTTAVYQNGNVGIGTSTPSLKLEVNGTIRSQEVKVEASPWPDYVFEENYELRSLAETEAYIKDNKHLPEIPSANEIETNGLALGEMNMLLLKKIEELTLYTIEANKENSKLRQQLTSNSQSQEKKIEELTLCQIEMMKIIKEQQAKIDELEKNRK